MVAKSRRPFWLLCLLSVSASVVSAKEQAPLARSRPNIILILTDDQGYAPIGRHGHPWLKTPKLDQLYDRSVRFTRFLACPTCSPTRSELMTGRAAMRNGITHTMNERERLTLDAVTLPQVLQRANYRTAIFGKWHLGDEDAYQPQRRGFEEAFIHGAGGIGQAYACSCADAPGNRYFDPIVRHNGRFETTRGFCTDVFFAAARQWIDAVCTSDQPFFAYIATNAPHSPYLAPQEATARYLAMGMEPDQAAFYGMIENIDANVGKLLDHLEQRHLMEKTLVIFMSDSGMAGDGAGISKSVLGRDANGRTLVPYNADMRGTKNTVDEGGVRVPFFVCWPDHVGPPRDVALVASSIDVFPTLAHMAGADLPVDQVEGRSLVPLLESDIANVDWPDRYLFTNIGRWPVGANPDDEQWKNFAVRNHRFRWVNNGPLYDMEHDPGQSTDVSSRHPEVVAAMRSAYEAWWQATRPRMINESQPLAKTRPFHEAYREQLEREGIGPWKPTLGR